MKIPKFHKFRINLQSQLIYFQLTDTTEKEKLKGKKDLEAFIYEHSQHLNDFTKKTILTFYFKMMSFAQSQK